MSPGPVLRAMRGGLTRRRVQAVVIAVVLLVSTGASVLGLALAADSNAPFDRAFAAQRGADATVTINSSLATPAELAATGRLPQVTAAAGPFPEANVALDLGSPSGCSNPTPGSPCYGAQTLPATLVGRASPAGPVDDVDLQSGHWAQRPGQVVLSSAEAYPNGNLPAGSGLGTQLMVTGVAGTPTLTVVAAPFARPSRSAFTLVVVGLGATAVILMVGLGGSLSRVVYGLSLARTEQVRVDYIGGLGSAPPGPGAGQGTGPVAGGAGPLPVGQPMDAATRRVVAAALRAQPGTLHYVAEADEQATVYGVSGQVPVTAYLGSAGWTGYGMISGRWYSGPGQVDVPAYFLAVTGKAIGDTVTIAFAGRQMPVRIVGEIFDNDNNGLAMVTGWQTLASADPALAAARYDVGLRPGTSPAGYARLVEAALGEGYVAGVNSNNKGLPLVLGLIGSLALLLAAAAGLGVLAAVMLQTRERAYHMGVFRAVGMTPRQTIAMVVCSVAGTGLVAGVAAIPAGIALLRYLVPIMGADAGTGMPPSYLNVYGGAELAGLALAGVVIAVAGALLPATWAARGATSSVLRAE